MRAVLATGGDGSNAQVNIGVDISGGADNPEQE